MTLCNHSDLLTLLDPDCSYGSEEVASLGFWGPFTKGAVAVNRSLVPSRVSTWFYYRPLTGYALPYSLHLPHKE